MTPTDRVLAALAEADPVDSAAPPTPAQRAAADAIRARVLNSPPPPMEPRRRRGPVAVVPVISVLVVLAIAAIFLRAGDRGRHDAAAGRAPQTLTLQALPTATRAITPRAIAKEVQGLRRRLGSVSGDLAVRAVGRDLIRVTAAHGLTQAQRARLVALLAQPPRLLFYDWEADVLTAGGQTVAARLSAQDPRALLISQGGAAGPGGPGAGGMTLFDAVGLAAKQPSAAASPTLSRLGRQYYLFGRAGSAACAAAAADRGAAPAPGRPCLLSGPDDEPAAATADQAAHDLQATLPPGVTPTQALAQGRVLSVPQGITVVRAADLTPAAGSALADPGARFFVLRDHVALTGADITHPAATTSAGSPAIRFGFTARGAARFRSVTALIARRGTNVSLGSQLEFQHFAVVLSGTPSRLLTVPYIDFRQYPDGITRPGEGAVLTAPMTAASARTLAAHLREAPLPLDLRLIR